MNKGWEPSAGGAPIDFWIDVEPQSDTVQLIPAGELDIATVGQLQRELDDLIEAGFGQIVIDLRGVEFIDSTGLHALVEAHERAKDEGWQLALVPGRHAVQQLFEITGTIEQLPFTHSSNGAGSYDPRNAQLPHRPYGVELAAAARSRPFADPTLHTDPSPLWR
jgi:anti-sigma B factor antagonist